MEIHNCSSCGGRLEYSPDNKALKCEKCLNLYSIEMKVSNQKKRTVLASIEDKGFEKWRDSKRTFQCQKCGAQIVLNKFEMATKCSYCNTSSLVPTDKLPGLKPDAVVPFKISKEKANSHFKKDVLSKRFLPNDFRKNIPDAEIGATYISSFNFGLNVFATYHGMRAVSKTIYTKNGTRTITEHVPFSGNIQKAYDNIVVESSDKIDQSQINGILPYDFKESFVFDDDFLAGFNVEYYNQTVSDATGVAKKVALNMLDSAIRSKHGRVVSLTINPTYSNEAYNYVLLPLYFVNFKYKEKQYLNLMNGQSGKTSGKLPKSAFKITFFVLALVLLVVGLPLLIVLLTMI